MEDAFQAHWSDSFPTVNFSFSLSACFPLASSGNELYPVLPIPAFIGSHLPPTSNFLTCWSSMSPLKDVHSVWNFIKFLEVRAIQLPGRWDRPMTGTLLREREAEFSCLAAARGQSLRTPAHQTTQMNGLAKLSQSSSGLAPAQAVSCPGSVFHNRWQWEEAWRLFQVEAVSERHCVALQLTEQHVFQSSFNCPNKKDVLHWCYEVCCPTRPGECQSDVCTSGQQQRGIQIRAPDLKAWIFTSQPLW